MINWEQDIVKIKVKTNPFQHTEAVGLAKKVNLEMVKKVCFNKEDYLGCLHKRGLGGRSNESFHLQSC